MSDNEIADFIAEMLSAYRGKILVKLRKAGICGEIETVEIRALSRVAILKLLQSSMKEE